MGAPASKHVENNVKHLKMPARFPEDFLACHALRIDPPSEYSELGGYVFAVWVPLHPFWPKSEAASRPYVEFDLPKLPTRHDTVEDWVHQLIGDKSNRDKVQIISEAHKETVNAMPQANADAMHQANKEQDLFA